MTDFPATQCPLFFHTYSIWSSLVALRNHAAIAPASITWTANQAIYMPVTLPWPYPVNRVFWVNGSVVTTSNCDFGIYSQSGARLYSTTSTAQSGTNVPQFVTPTTPFTLPAGRYYFAWVSDNTTNRGFGNLSTVAFQAMSGLLTQATALPLPATETFATVTNVGQVLCGIT